MRACCPNGVFFNLIKSNFVPYATIYASFEPEHRRVKFEGEKRQIY